MTRTPNVSAATAPPIDYAAHYKAVKARIAQAARVAAPFAPKPVLPSPQAVPEAPTAPAAPAPLRLAPPPPVLARPCANPVGKDAPRPRKRPRAVIEPVLRAHEVTWAEIVSPSRQRHLIAPRLAVYAALHDAGYSLNQIGKFCRRDHTTVMHYLKKWCAYQTDPRFSRYRVTL